MRKHNLVIRTSITLLALGAFVGCRSDSSSSDHTRRAQTGTSQSNNGGVMNASYSTQKSCQEMRDQRERLAAEMKAQDTALVARVAEMNKAPEGSQLRLLAGIVTQMAEQRAATDVKMDKMSKEMMQHMMEHMEAGGDSMASCPMMTSMNNKGM